MSYIGRPVKEDEIRKTEEQPDIRIVSVPERPSERAARRRDEREVSAPAAPVRREEPKPVTRPVRRTFRRTVRPKPSRISPWRPMPIELPRPSEIPVRKDQVPS